MIPLETFRDWVARLNVTWDWNRKDLTELSAAQLSAIAREMLAEANQLRANALKKEDK